MSLNPRTKYFHTHSEQVVVVLWELALETESEGERVQVLELEWTTLESQGVLD